MPSDPPPEPQQQPQQQSLYRRHRPRTFDEVEGQQSVVRTLRNAVEQHKVHHAYLFVGSRGTGKTSMAKILAACLNCERGPTATPCGECESCRAIAAATSLDVIEMDAASNNSVEDIRELRERIAFAPVSGRHKVYILDEAHMLSQAAWNAFLKTLEEPPPSTVFVLATTDAQKVPATVVDRCHRFEFQRPTAEQISSVVRRVADAERIGAPPAAVAAIARSATGSFRDALGTLEQLVTYGGSQIALDDVLAVLGVVEAEILEELLDAVSAGDSARVLLAISRCSERGRDAGALASDLESRARDLLVVQALGEVPRELSLTPEADEGLLSQACGLKRAVLVRVLDLLAAAREATRAGADARTQLELALVKAASPELDSSTAALLVRMERLEARLAPTEGRAADGASSNGNPADSFSARRPESAEISRVESAENEVGAEKQERAQNPQAAESGERAQSGETAERGETAESAETADGLQNVKDARAASVDDLDSLRQQWPKALEMIRAENALLGALIAEAQPVHLDGSEVTLAFAPTAAFLKRKAEDRAHYDTVADKLGQITGRRIQLSYELREGIAQQQHTAAEEELVARLVAELDAEELPAADVSDGS